MLGRYLLLERLGSGGFGEVWRAHDELLNREVAVKEIQGGEGERAAREAQAAARLSHPAIVALYEATSEEGVFYLTSELVEGATLAELIEQDALEDAEIFEIGLALCDALRHAHSRGVIHRDVKPQNILVPDDPEDRGVAKLTDFGGARLDGEQALTATGDVLGTFAYMAPEQSEGRLVGPEADLYSLALVLYEALSGVNPVRAATPAATVRRIGARLPPLRRARRDLPKRPAAAIDLALHPDPQRRGDLEDLAAALAHAIPDSPDADDHRVLASDCADYADEAEGAEPLTAEEGPILPFRPTGHAAERSAVHPVGRSAEHTLLAPARNASRTPQRTPLRADSDENPHIGRPAPQQRSGRSALAAPKILWTLAALALIVFQLASGRPGLALLLLAGALPLLALMPRWAGPGWLIPVLAPALGLAGLASAYPALAARPAAPRLRLALGALGFWWLCLAQLTVGRFLAPAVSLLGLKGVHGSAVGQVPLSPVSGWEGSLTSAAHVLAPLIGLPALAGAALWALGALLLPALLRGRSPFLHIALATAWSVTMLVGPAALSAALGGPRLALAAGVSTAVPAAVGSAPAILGAVLGALLAVGSIALRAPSPRQEPYRGSAHSASRS